jgi:Ca-activated chloride channel family protein
MFRTIESDDPRLTAYALGELDSAERAEVARLLTHSPEAQAALAEIKQTVALLESQLQAEPCPALTAPQRELIQQAQQAHAKPEETVLLALPPEPAAVRQRNRRRWIVNTVAGVLSACLLVALVLPAFHMARESARRVATTRGSGNSQDEAQPPGSYQQPQQSASSLGRGRAGAEIEELAEHDQGVNKRNGGVFLGLEPNGMFRSDLDIPTGQLYEAADGYTVDKPVEESRVTSNQPKENAQTWGMDSDGDTTAYFALPLYAQPADRYLRQALSRREKERAAMMGGIGGMGGGMERTTPLTPEEMKAEEDDLAEYLAALDEVQQELHDVIENLPADTRPSLAGAEKSDEFRNKLQQIEDLQLELRELAEEAKQEKLYLIRRQQERSNTEAYAPVEDNPFLGVTQNPLSTFSIDVDTASYSNVRRFLQSGQLPPPAAVRIEELLNYFRYSYAGPEGDVPFAVHTEVAECPWQPEHRLLRVALAGREIPAEARPNSNLVFLIDVSGSMQDENKLPLVKAGLRMLVNQLREADRVAMVVYAGSSGLVLDSTTGDQKETILAAIDRLDAGGSTNGAAGIQQAYDVAAAHLIKEGTNRVILATDGDFNVGVTSQGELTDLIEQQAKSGVFLTVLGFGMGNYKDATLEQLADKGNGNYAYVDGQREAQKVLVEQLSGTLVTIAKDVKLQLEFNPVEVQAYRLIGYENRLLAKEDFQDDTKDAGEIGAGHTVTALYELVPAGQEAQVERPVAGLEFQTVAAPTEAAKTSGQLLALKLRYKLPNKDVSEPELKFGVTDAKQSFGQASQDFQFAAAVAGFGMLLRHSPYAGTASFASMHEIAGSAVGGDAEGYRRELVELIAAARKLTAEPTPAPATPDATAPADSRY